MDCHAVFGGPVILAKRVGDSKRAFASLRWSVFASTCPACPLGCKSWGKAPRGHAVDGAELPRTCTTTRLKRVMNLGGLSVE